MENRVHAVIRWSVAAIVLTLAAIILTGCIFGLMHRPPEVKQYPTCGIIVENDERTETVTVEDFNGNHWQFNGVEDWLVGDIVSMIMSDNGTPDTIYDDQIVMVKYSGYRER